MTVVFPLYKLYKKIMLHRFQKDQELAKLIYKLIILLLKLRCNSKEIQLKHKHIKNNLKLYIELPIIRRNSLSL